MKNKLLISYKGSATISKSYRKTKICKKHEEDKETVAEIVDSIKNESIGKLNVVSQIM